MKITYEDKVSIQNDESVARKNKVTDTDMNEIKEVVNANANEQTTMQTYITNIKAEQTTQNTNISNLQKDNTTNKQDITEIKAKDTEQDNKILQLQTEKAELEKELKEMKEDFYQNSIRGQASGEYIHVEDSSNCRARIGIGGNSEQETRSGKNKLNSASIEVGTNNGITCTYDSKTGIITFNGACNTDNTCFTFKNTSIPFTNNLTKMLAYYVSGSITTYCSFRTFDRNWSAAEILNLLDLSSSKNKTRIISSNTTIKTNINIRFNNGSVANNFQIKLMITDSENDDYEQYGASPSPDYPSEIKTVGSNMNLIEETFKGYNLNGHGAFEVSSGFNMQIAKVKANVIYTLNTKTNVLGYYNEKPTLTSVTYNKSRTVLPGDANTIVATRDGYIAIRTIDAEKVKCVEGTEVGEYSKHGQGCVKVTKCNKNLFDKNTTTDGKYIGGNGSIQTQSNIMYSDYIQIKTNINYYITGRSEWSSVVLYDKNKTFLERISTTQPNGVLNITNSNCKYIIINALLTNKDTLQLEEGASTSYEPHKEQSYIMPVQQEMLEGDYFDFDNEEEVHTWNKLVLKGSEEFNSWTGNAPSGYKVFYSRILTNAINSQGDLKCNALKYIENPWESGKNAIGLQRIFKEVYISIESKYASTLEEFKTYLKSQYDAGTPVVIYYKLATPTRLPFTEEQKAVAKELNNARTYKNVTNITTDSIAILDLDYAKDLETLLTSKESEV